MPSYFFELAQPVLLKYWLWHWAAILGLGSLHRWSWRGVRLFNGQKRIPALAALLVCIGSVPLLVDTVFWDMSSEHAFRVEVCSLAASSGHAQALAECPGGVHRFSPGEAAQVVSVQPGAQVVRITLSASGYPVGWAPAP